MEDYVVLVNEKNEVLGTSPKLATHSDHTPLHRGFSAFLFNKDGMLLLQQRSHKKKTWPLTWSNSVCGHPMLDESPIDAAKRRFSFELGISNVSITMVLPNYRYRFEKDSIVENELCPVMIAFSDEIPAPNPDEVESIEWISWNDWIHRITNTPDTFSPWAVEESHLLATSEIVKELLLHNPLPHE